MNKKPLEVKETQAMRKERVRNSPSLHTRVVESKKKYNRKRNKAQMRRLAQGQSKNFFQS